MTTPSEYREVGEVEAGVSPAVALAHMIDPDAYQDHPIEQRRPVAALQWAARRKIAYDHAINILAAGYLSPEAVAALVAQARAEGAEVAARIAGLRDRWATQTTNMCDGCTICDGGRRQMLDHCVQQLDRLLNEAEGGADDA